MRAWSLDWSVNVHVSDMPLGGLHEYYLKDSDKTDMLLVSSRCKAWPDFPGITVGDTCIQPSSHVRHLGVTFEKSFSWEKEVNNKVWESYYHVRYLRIVHKYLTQFANLCFVQKAKLATSFQVGDFHCASLDFYVQKWNRWSCFIWFWSLTQIRSIWIT